MQRQLAAQFRVSPFFVIKVLGLHRRGEQIQEKRRGGRIKAILTNEMRIYLRDHLAVQNDLTRSELSSRISDKFGLTVSTPTLCRILRQMSLRRKKKESLCQRMIV